MSLVCQKHVSDPTGPSKSLGVPVALTQAAQCEVEIPGSGTGLTWVYVLAPPFTSFTALVHGPFSVLIWKTGLILALLSEGHWEALSRELT